MNRAKRKGDGGSMKGYSGKGRLGRWERSRWIVGINLNKIHVKNPTWIPRV